MTHTQKAGIVLRVLMTMFIMIGLFNVLNYIDKHEERRGVVIDVDNNDCVTMMDKTGNEWQFFADGLEVGNMIVVTMDTHNTETVEDDEIIDVRIK